MDGKLQNLESYLKGRVIGQEDAIARVSRAIEAAEYDLNDRGPRPKGSFLFMGSRGIGKCLGKGAEVLLASGEVVPAEKVRVGDVLMGDDGTPRHVLSI